MKLIRCDRCHGELPVDPAAGTLAEVPGYVPVTVGGLSLMPGSGTSYDLCARCAAAVKRFLAVPPPSAPKGTSS